MVMRTWTARLEDYFPYGKNLTALFGPMCSRFQILVRFLFPYLLKLFTQSVPVPVMSKIGQVFSGPVEQCTRLEARLLLI